MTRDEASQLEAEFGIVFPQVYREAITDSYPFSEATEELDTDAGSLRQSNQECRRENPWGFPWRTTYWCIGGDGAGGFYFIDTKQDDSTVYYCDHEDMPSSIEDVDHISITPFSEFIEEVKQLEKDMVKWEEEMKTKVANRKWWQFWIPRQWPPKPSG
jgi:hypothetical protein